MQVTFGHFPHPFEDARHDPSVRTSKAKRKPSSRWLYSSCDTGRRSSAKLRSAALSIRLLTSKITPQNTTRLRHLPTRQTSPLTPPLKCNDPTPQTFLLAPAECTREMEWVVLHGLELPLQREELLTTGWTGCSHMIGWATLVKLRIL